MPCPPLLIGLSVHMSGYVPRLKRHQSEVWITALLVGIAVLIGTLVSKDPGYVLIAYGPYQLQTSVWMMLGLVIAAWLLVRLVVSIIRQALGIGQHWQEWQARRERLKARRFVYGLVSFASW